MKWENVGTGLATWYAFGMPLYDLIHSPYFKIKSTGKVDGDNREELVRIEFDHLTDDSTQKAFRISNGYLICDPTSHWALKEYGGVTWAGELYKGQVEWSEQVDGFPQPKRLLISIKNEKLPKNTEFHLLQKITDIQTSAPRELFFLSYYGFTEPVFETGWLNTWMKYLLSGLACMGIAYWIKRRRAAAAG